MAISEVKICNLALSHIGAASINALTENTVVAEACNLHYEPTRDAVLRDHAWGFARKRQILALLPETFSGFEFAYAYPIDCMSAIEIFRFDGNSSGTGIIDPRELSAINVPKVAFETSVNDDLNQEIILTDKADAELIYTAKITTPALFDPIFVEALSFALAVKLAQPLKADRAIRDDVKRDYLRIVERAKAVNANETFQKTDESNNVFVSSRGF